jgi:tRNA (mo5U34)-methyltransferase
MESVEEASIRAQIESVSAWYHRFELGPGLVTPGINDSGAVLQRLALPEDCRGIRALDLGTRDGFFAFELRRRGAEVVAVDYMPMELTGFGVARRLLGMDVEYTQENIYNMRPEVYGTFGIVLFLGLLYHLPDPMAALRIVRSLCSGELYLETHVLDEAVLLPDGTFTTLEAVAPGLAQSPIMQFYPGSSLGNDPTNYWAPNYVCMQRMLEESNFEVVRGEMVSPRAIFKCRAKHDSRLVYFNGIASGSLRL